ncbi:MAG: hypothetical protein DPW16_18875 [Chloroflexi bacterium]|nr:hypothetical protein [Chloroflexota bacterium]
MVSFGEKYRRLYHEIISPNHVLKGCTEDEIDQVKEFQEVSYIPAIYRDLLTVMGHCGLSDFLMGDAYWEKLKSTKGLFEWFAKASKLTAYPQDILVFFDDLGQLFYFFRTKDHLDDPPVYSYPYGNGPASSRFAKLSESLSEFFLSRLQIYSTFIKTGIEKWEPLTQVYYDANLDDFRTVEK